MKTQLQERITYLLTAVLLLLLLYFAVLHQNDRAIIKNLRERHRIASLVYKELPLGSDKSQVIKFLNGYGIPHSDYLKEGDIASVYGAPAVVECRIKLHSIFPYETDLNLLFRFNKDDKLQSFDDQLNGRFF
jgi:hypothetical protein